MTKEEKKAKKAGRNAKRNANQSENKFGNITIIFVDRMTLKADEILKTNGKFKDEDYWMKNVFNDNEDFRIKNAILTDDFMFVFSEWNCYRIAIKATGPN